MQDTYATQLQTGTDVYGSDGEKIGSIAGVAQNHFVIENGLIFTTDIYVPMSSVTSVDDDRVTLSLTKEQVEDADWGEEPDDDHDHDDTYAGGTAAMEAGMYTAADSRDATDRDGLGTSVTDTERVEETVRREEIDIDDEAGATRQNRGEHS
jgi:hypothetical protein